MENCFSGEYYNTLDDKGRIAFPSKLQTNLKGDTIWVTKGMGKDRSLLIYSPEEWEKTVKDFEKRLSIYNSETRWLYRKFISPAQEINIDKNGRIAIPQSLREHAGLKKDCVFLGMGSVAELWDVEIYKDAELKASEAGINIFEELGKLISV
ncbi:MAG TPA: division/cell wall cluster transcriptional repressor MraZ [Spirochaetota bacterium]|nr:division/cell wall cluster transcriptional repressor MraZ [Spirochaetota bacterium]